MMGGVTENGTPLSEPILCKPSFMEMSMKGDWLDGEGGIPRRVRDGFRCKGEQKRQDHTIIAVFALRSRR